VVPTRILVGLAALGAAACAGILGIDNRSLDPELADASVSQEGGGGDDGSQTPGADGSAGDAQGSSGGGPDGRGADAPSLGPEAGVDAPSCTDPCLLVSGLNHPFLMAADATNVYWTEFGDDLGTANGYVKACAVGGCPSGPVVYAQGLTNPRGIAVDAQNVYFGTATYGAVTGGIWSCAVGGCAGSPTHLAAATIPYGVAVDGTFVYWVDNDDGTVHKVPKSGGTALVLYDGGVYDDAGNTLSELGQCVVDGPYLFFGDYSEDLVRMSVNGGTPAFLGNGFNNAFYGSYFGVTTDTASVYSGGNGNVYRANKLVANSGATVASGIAEPIGLVRDPASGLLYWANYGSGNANDGTVGKVGTDGGGQRVLQSALTTPDAVAVSGNWVFWLSNGTLVSSGGTQPSTGALWRTAK
jgi:hypothetical protein